MDRAPDDAPVDDSAQIAPIQATTAEAAPSAAPTQDVPAAAPAPAVRELSVAEQIRRQVRDEAAGGAPADPNFDFQMRMRAGGVELTNEAQEFTAETGKDFAPPTFEEGGWPTATGDAPPAASGGLRWVVIGGLLVVLAIATWMYGVPAWKEHQEKQAEAAKQAELASHPPLEALALDDAFHSGLRDALVTANKELQAGGQDAYAYRYRAADSTVTGVSQAITITVALGGKAATAVAGAGRGAFDKALQPWVDSVQAHPGVTATFLLLEAERAGAPLDDDHYIRYGHDYGREHMAEIQPVIDKLANRKAADGEYPRVLDTGSGPDMLRTSGGFSFTSRGFGYLPIYKTDGAGHILMGSGDSTIDRLTPQAVGSYYLFVYLDQTSEGLDFYGPDALAYYTNKIAPLPYDPGAERLHNVQLSPDGTPDGIACIIKDGQVLDS